MNKLISTTLFIGVLVLQGAAIAQQEEPVIETTQLTERIYMLTGPGGNITAFVGDEGTILIDDKHEGRGPAIQSALESVGGAVPKYLVNTHFHNDHSGSNRHFGERGSIIVGHTLLHDYLSEGYVVEQFNNVVEPVHEHALPELTYSEQMEVHLSGELVHLIHVPDAHTDTDTIVFFTESNLIATGDVMFNGFFPFIDIPNNGSLAGMIDALKLVTELADENTTIIPGHGPIASRGDVLDTIDILELAQQRLSNLKQDDRTLEQALAVEPLSDIEQDWGGFIFTADEWIEMVWDSL